MAGASACDVDSVSINKDSKRLQGFTTIGGRRDKAAIDPDAMERKEKNDHRWGFLPVFILNSSKSTSRTCFLLLLLLWQDCDDSAFGG